MTTSDHSDTNRRYVQNILRAMAEDASRLPLHARIPFLQKRVNKALRVVRKHYWEVVPSAFECEEQLGLLLAGVGVSESPLQALRVWDQTLGNHDERLEKFLDSLTFGSAHHRVAAQLKAETFMELLKHFSALDRAYSEDLDELRRLERVRALLKERNRVKAGSLVYRVSQLAKFVTELNYWLPGLNWSKDFECDEQIAV